jgi:hypothetical protein
VALRLFKPDGSRVYPVGTDKMPVGFVPITGGWTISAAEKTRTGIEDFQILQPATLRSLSLIKLVDTRTSLPKADYSQVRIEMVIGNDAGSLDLNLVERNSRWFLA